MIEGWTRVRNARGGTGSHHITFELALPDGRILRTRISHPPDRTDYGPALWGHVLRDQLQVTEAEFWACVHERVAPRRGAPEPPPDALPAALVHQLITTVGLRGDEVAGMTKEEALARLMAHWTAPPESH